jgi:hypothetical protein
MPGPPGDVRVAFLTHPTVRNTDPNIDDWGVVSRVITSIVGPLLVQELRPFTVIRPVVPPVATMPNPAGIAGSLIVAASPPGPSPLFSGGRRGLYVYNNSQIKFLYLCLVSGPISVPPPLPLPVVPIISQSSFTLRLAPQSEYVVPFPIFSGWIFGAFSPGIPDAPPFGNVLVAELF